MLNRLTGKTRLNPSFWFLLNNAFYYYTQLPTKHVITIKFYERYFWHRKFWNLTFINFRFYGQIMTHQRRIKFCHYKKFHENLTFGFLFVSHYSSNLFLFHTHIWSFESLEFLKIFKKKFCQRFFSSSWMPALCKKTFCGIPYGSALVEKSNLPHLKKITCAFSV